MDANCARSSGVKLYELLLQKKLLVALQQVFSFTSAGDFCKAPMSHISHSKSHSFLSSFISVQMLK